MKRLFSVTIILMFLGGLSHAQTTLKGTVYEQGTNKALDNVFIRDNNTRQVSITDKNGKFEIQTAQGHTLIFNSPGYAADTLYLIDMRPKKVMLATTSIALNQVTITSTRPDFNPRVEYPEVYEKSKVYVLSPSTWFSKEGRRARKLKKYFRYEAEQRQIDAAFSRSYVGSIVPLKGKDLENFMTMYRPSYKFLRSNNRESMVAYINDSYKKFMALPPDKREVQPLN
ncbi:carboxypeptidase-like regulatory domain-containing protein [Mucilaginibacter litoreus]|uniref:Carboxypeptidase-like regulatory domain-containing protein n=1 Tax=Mucilaginibacter litoreus TaxID=1048221 RepID=A0ABW3AV50_9SPHI